MALLLHPSSGGDFFRAFRLQLAPSTRCYLCLSFPFPALAMFAVGMGLLSLTPVLNFLATWGISRKHRGKGGQTWSTWWKRGVLGAVFVLFVLEAPGVWTRIGLQRALSEKETSAERGVAQLRLFRNEKTLLRACYEGNRGTSMATDISGWMMDGWQMALPMLWDEPFRSFDSEKVRSVYYRVTGDAYNSKKPPSFVTKGSILGGSRGQNWNEVQWDDHLGGEEVAVRLANLDLVQSRVDGHLDSSSGLAYQEWTMVFRNDNIFEAQEARMQMMLPEDGVVSRVTLWVNGEPREAAFSSKSKVRAAYQAIAVKQRRDPVLVTATGPGRVLVQCFPVPADGGEMKIRIGMTSPVKNGRVATPFLLERNFGIAQDMETSLWMQAPRKFSFQGEQKSHGDGPGQSLQLKLPASGIQREGGYFESQNKPAQVVWCEDQFAEPGEERLIRTLISSNQDALSQCIVVVDGSESMRPFADAIQKAVSGFAGSQDKVTVVIADDGVSQSDLSSYRFTGGRDNGPALEWALRKAREQEKSAVVWLHGPQPLGSAHEESLAQLLERGTSEIPLYSVAFKPGGNRLLEKLFQYRSVRMGPRLSKGTEDFGPWLESLVNGGPTMVSEWKREGLESDPELVEGKKVWDQLARWWAADQVRNAGRQQSAGEESVAFAAKYQLVTAFSGAVVLETAEQFKQHGLEPVDPSTTPHVPATPEPGTWLLLLIGAFCTLTRRRRA